MSLCEKCKRHESKAMRALESLTAGGSEFVDEPARCAEHIRESRGNMWRMILKLTKENKELQKELHEIKLERDEVILQASMRETGEDI